MSSRKVCTDERVLKLQQNFIDNIANESNKGVVNGKLIDEETSKLLLINSIGLDYEENKESNEYMNRELNQKAEFDKVRFKFSDLFDDLLEYRFTKEDDFKIKEILMSCVYCLSDYDNYKLLSDFYEQTETKLNLICRKYGKETKDSEMYTLL